MRISEIVKASQETDTARVVIAPPVSVDSIKTMRLEEVIDDVENEEELLKLNPKEGTLAFLKVEAGTDSVIYKGTGTAWAKVIVEADAESRAETTDLIKTLAVLVLRRRKQDVTSLMPSYEKYLAGAKKFMKRHKAPTEAFDAVASEKSLDAISRNKKYMGKNFSERATDFVSEFRPAFQRIKSSANDVSSEQMNTLNAIFTLLNTPDSESAFQRLSKHITVTNDLKLIPAFSIGSDIVGEKKDLRTALDKILKKHGGKITKDIRDKLREQNPDKLKQINKLQNNLRTRLEQDIREAVLSASKGKADWAFIEDVIPLLKKKGYTDADLKARYHNLLNYKKQIGLNVNAFITAKDGTPTTAKAISPAIVNLEVNTLWPNKYNYIWKTQTEGQSGTKHWGKIATVTHHAVSQAKKDEFVLDVLDEDKFERAKKAWRSTNKSPKDRTFSMLAEALYWTAARIGSGEGSTKGGRTYGLSTLLGKHVKVRGATKLELDYIGKSGQHQTHILNLATPTESTSDKNALKNLIAYIKERKDKIDDDDLLFSIGGNRINPTEFNAWMKKIFKDSRFKAHTMRTIRGTQIAIPVLEEAKKVYKKEAKSANTEAKKDKVANDVFIKSLIPVGKQLGHFTKDVPTAMTAISKGYIVTKVMNDWFTDLGRRPNTTINRALEKGHIASES